MARPPAPVKRRDIPLEYPGGPAQAITLSPAVSMAI
jgi:hypothetical protein